MSDTGKSSTSTEGIPPGWARIWIGGALLSVAVLLQVAGVEAGGREADGASMLLLLTILAGFFGAVHLLIGCVMQGIALHEGTKVPTEPS